MPTAKTGTPGRHQGRCSRAETGLWARFAEPRAWSRAAGWAALPWRGAGGSGGPGAGSPLPWARLDNSGAHHPQDDGHHGRAWGWTPPRPDLLAGEGQGRGAGRRLLSAASLLCSLPPHGRVPGSPGCPPRLQASPRTVMAKCPALRLRQWLVSRSRGRRDSVPALVASWSPGSGPRPPSLATPLGSGGKPRRPAPAPAHSQAARARWTGEGGTAPSGLAWAAARATEGLREGGRGRQATGRTAWRRTRPGGRT